MINFLKYTWIYTIISAVVIIVGIYSVIRYGFSYSIDFIGGSLIEYRFTQPIDQKDLRQEFEKEQIKISSFTLSDKNTYVIKTANIESQKEAQIRANLEKKLHTKFETLRFETVGGSFGHQTQQKTVIAGTVAVVGILIYIAFTFNKLNYGLAAVGALIHDLLVVVGSYSLISYFFGAEFDSLFVTAILTTMSFSVHDTIVVFEKIKEYRALQGTAPFELSANKALTETMVRSLNNSLTIVLMLIALVLLGGALTRFFVVALLIGTITGTYSSPFVAVPLLWFLERKK